MERFILTVGRESAAGIVGRKVEGPNSKERRVVRYADDCNIYVASERAGKRVMQSVTGFIRRQLKLKVNEAKSAVARPQERKFLGFSFTGGRETETAHRAQGSAPV
jgi:retron-type reverse transcriptase